MIDPDKVDRAQVRAARALLDWTQPELAKAANVALATLKRFEIGQTQPIPTVKSAIVRALEAQGIEFDYDRKRASVSLDVRKLKRSA
ncbi:helix-turn-helix transcriptional regulator [Bradyrhizobium sp. 62]|uniref:helix-turn-helix domain-containing protein n=1 Tax=Bradyrhizobium sp. 62 TaxID=1043588 RepID=UPI001FF99406|nr:helix-turn-helix transcriptional regulator [Bradyrhizobium sp. 62]MCK1367252.1 helix-turn-helix transcriptional regulator [Bradyrhizobium sp. 62]